MVLLSQWTGVVWEVPRWGQSWLLGPLGALRVLVKASSPSPEPKLGVSTSVYNSSVVYSIAPRISLISTRSSASTLRVWETSKVFTLYDGDIGDLEWTFTELLPSYILLCNEPITGVIPRAASPCTSEFSKCKQCPDLLDSLPVTLEIFVCCWKQQLKFTLALCVLKYVFLSLLTSNSCIFFWNGFCAN